VPGGEVRRADIAHFARGNQEVQGAEGLLERSLTIPAVQLEQVDVIGAEPLEARLGRRDDVMARQPSVVGFVAHRESHLGRDENVFTIAAECFAQDFL